MRKAIEWVVRRGVPSAHPASGPPGVVNLSALLGAVLPAVLLVLSAAACQQALETRGGDGSLSLGVAEVAAKSVADAPQPAPERYVFSGSGPRGTEFSVVTTDETQTVSALAAGEWTVRAEGLNGEDEPVLAGEAAVTIEPYKQTALELVLEPVDGAGDLRVSAEWNPEHTLSAEVRATVTNADDEATTYVLNVQADGLGERVITGLPTGSYRVSVQLYDGDEPIGGSAHTVRVVNQSVVSVGAELTALNKVGKPVEIRGESFTIGWDPPEETAPGSYRVYYRTRGEYDWTLLSEAEAQTSPRFTVTAELLDYGTYELAVSSVSGGHQSQLHTSMCDEAQPGSGWYVKWSAE